MDIPLVEKLVRMVRSGFDANGQPPHRQLPATATTVGPETNSMFFRVDCKTYNSMTATQKQEIIRDRNIIVTGVDHGRHIEFDADGLETLADLDAKVSFQCMFIQPRVKFF